MKNKLGSSHASALFAIALALVPVTGHCDWLSSITGLFGSKGKGMNTNIAAGEASHIKVVREVALEVGRGAPDPQALVQTKDGGYVMAGELFQIPWATRTDIDGKLQWRYVADMPEWKPGGNRGKYGGVAILPDDSTILCGNRELPPTPGKRVGDMVGILTHLDKAGQVQNHQILYPNGDKSYSLSYLDKCVPWGDGVAVAGHVSRWLKAGDKHVLEASFWLLALDGKGDIKWERLIPNPSDGTFKRIEAMPNGNLMLVAEHPVNNAPSVKVTRIGIDGDVTGEKVIPGDLMASHSTPSDPSLYLFPRLLIPKFDASISLWTLDGDLANAKRLVGKAPGIGTGVFYRLPDGSLFLVGSEYGEGNAAMAWVSADLNKQETYIFKPEHASVIWDAISTGKPGEFVTVRRSAISNQDKRQGVVLTFVQVK